MLFFRRSTPPAIGSRDAGGGRVRTFRRFVRRTANRLGYDITRHIVAPPGTVSLGWEEMRRALAIHRCFALAADVPGAIVECGVGRGASFTALVLMAQAEGRDREVWGFDSFQGFPTPSPEDASPKSRRKGELFFGTRDDVARAILGSDVDERFFTTHCHLVPGFFEDSLRHFSGDRIAFLHLDVDLYRSYTTCLTALYPKVSPGGVVLFDEYADDTYPGARKAIDEFFGAAVRDLRTDPYMNNRYLIKKKAR
jgi:hypothetical protein